MPDIVGITVQRRSVRGLEAKVSRGGRCTVLRTAEVEVGEGVFDAGQLIDAEAFTQCLRDLWEQGGFRTKQVRLVIDGRLAVIRRTELPSLGKAQLREAAGYDIGELLNFPIDEAVFDVDEIERFDRSGTTWAKALVVAVQESTLTELEAAVTAAGLRLHGTDLAAEALVRGVRSTADDALDTEESDGPVAIIDSEDSSTNIVIRDRSGVLFARTLNVGVGETSISVADELESALAQLSTPHDDSDELSGPTSAGVPTVVEGVRRTLSYYEAELDERKLRQVLVGGARGQAAGLLSSLEDTLGLPAMSATSHAEWPNNVSIHGFETPIGAALGAAPYRTRHLVLTSDRERAQRRRRYNRATVAASAIPSIIFLAVSTLGLWSEIVDARAETAQGNEATDALALRRSAFDEIDRRVNEYRGTSDTMRAIEAQRLGLDLVVRELAATMPGDTQLLNIQLARGTTNELPPGYSGPTPAGLVTVSGTAGDLDAVSRWLASAEASQTLAGVWLERSTLGPIGASGEVGTVFSAEAVITTAAAAPDSMVQADLDGDDE